MPGTRGTGRWKEMFVNTATTADAVTSSFDFSYYSTCIVKAAKYRYVLLS